MRLVKESAAKLQINTEMLKRPLNVGFAGGEKKRAEILEWPCCSRSFPSSTKQTAV